MGELVGDGKGLRGGAGGCRGPWGKRGVGVLSKGKDETVRKSLRGLGLSRAKTLEYPGESQSVRRG